MNDQLQRGRQSAATDVLFWLTAPVAGFAVLIFGLYFWGLRRWGHTVARYPWGLTAGVAMVVANVAYNVVVGSIVFRSLPPWRNASGGFSPFFTTRLKLYRQTGRDAVLVAYLEAVINKFDPGHFSAATDLG